MLEINEKCCQKNERLFKQFHTLYLTRGEKLIVMKAINDNHSQSMAIIGNHVQSLAIKNFAFPLALTFIFKSFIDMLRVF
jgi:hypothetical protein